MRIAVLADIHGNSWALDAVLGELRKVPLDRVINLGDCFSGPLDPGGTFDRLREWTDWLTVRGNQDREIVDGFRGTPTAAYTLKQLGSEAAEWIEGNAPATVRSGPILACHGNLTHDDLPLLERIETGGVRLATGAELAVALAALDVGVEVVLCAHSHRPGMVRSDDGALILNPGSVGLPAYRDDEPHPHGMESGTPHARWAILERTNDGWQVELRATPYDTRPAVEAAEARGRVDWARWIGTGRA